MLSQIYFLVTITTGYNTLNTTLFPAMVSFVGVGVEGGVPLSCKLLMKNSIFLFLPIGVLFQKHKRKKETNKKKNKKIQNKEDKRIL